MAESENKDKDESSTIYYTPEMIMTSEFYQFPKWLMGTDLSNDSKILYMLLLDKYKLSLKNRWIDDDNRIYSYFSKESMQNMLGIGKTKCYELFKELKDNKFIEQKRQGQGKNNRLYLKSVDYGRYSQTSEKRTSENSDTEFRPKTYEKLTSGSSENGSQDVRNTDSSNNDFSSNENSKVSDSDSYAEENSSVPSILHTGSESEPDVSSDPDEILLRSLNDDQYEAFSQLLNKIRKRELVSSKASLLRYFAVLAERDWKDSKGEPIRNIVGYVTMNFVAHMKEIDEGEKYLRKDGYEPGAAYFAYRKNVSRDNDRKEE